MGCGCNKSKTTQSNGTLTPAQVQAIKDQQAAAKVPAASQANQLSPARGTTQQFALNLNDGQTLTFGSRLEADAENVRRGYTGRVVPPK